MICPHCGRYLEDGVAFCIYCGQRLGKYASEDAAEGSPTISLDEPISVEEPSVDPLAAVDAAKPAETGALHAAAGAAAGAAAATAATAPVAPANAQEESRRPSVSGRKTREQSRLHADDEIAKRMNELDDEGKPGRGRKVLGGVLLAALAAGAIGFGANYVAPSIMGGISSSSSAAQPSSSSSDASSSSSSSKASSSSSAKSSKSSKSSKDSSSSTETKRGSTLERANQADDQDAAGYESGGAADDTVEATPTTGEETTTGIVNTYVPGTSAGNGGGSGTGNGAGNGSTGWPASSATATATSVSPTEGSVSHGPELVLDGRTETAWNTNMDGVDESITISVDSSKPVAGLKILNGYNKISASGTDLYYANARAKKILVEYEGGSQEFTLEDLKGEYQELWFDDGDITTSWVKITIKSVYPGSLYDDCCISEIEVV